MVGTQISTGKGLWRFLLIFLFLGLSFGCDRPTKPPVKVSLASTKKSAPILQDQSNQSKPTLRVAISAIISPKETFTLYKDLLNYISRKLNVSLKLVQRETYAEVNNLVKDNELDLAFVCSGAYVGGHDQFGMELLVAPVAYGETVYYSYIIVPAESTAKSLEDLRHKRFAFSDPMSNTGKLAPTFMLAQLGENIDSFFSKTIFTYSHDRSIEMVNNSLVDGAAVDSLIWEYINRKNPALTAHTKIIKKSEPYGIPPVVVPAGLDPTLKENLRDLFLNLNTDTAGKKILAELLIDKFIVVDDHQYDSIRKMQRYGKTCIQSRSTKQ